jgi:hypothetical protein
VTVIELDPTGGAVVDGMPHETYLSHPALSASGCKLLVQPGGPARYRWRLDHPEPPRDAWDLGHAAHMTVLGAGPEVVVIDADSWRTKAAQQQRDEARAAGAVPLLAADAQRVQDMAASLRAHPVASRVLHPDSGRPEVSLFWHDEQYGVDRRGRVDWLRRADASGRLIVVDLKTAASADPGEFARAAARYGYAQQAAFYQDLVVGLGLASSAPFVFVVVEKEPPYLVSVIELDEPSLAAGRALNERAMRLFRECTDSGVWPGLTEDTVALVSLPPWALAAAYEEEPW